MAKNNPEKKPKWSLLPWEALELGVGALEYGKEKGGYGDFEWKEPPLFSKEALFESAERHLLSVLKGERVDSESGLLHASLLLARALMIAEYERLGLWGEESRSLPLPAPPPRTTYFPDSKTPEGSWDWALEQLVDGYLVRHKRWMEGAFLSKAEGQAPQFYYPYAKTIVMFEPSELDQEFFGWEIFPGFSNVSPPESLSPGTWAWALSLLGKKKSLRRRSWSIGVCVKQEEGFIFCTALSNYGRPYSFTLQDRKAEDWETC